MLPGTHLPQCPCNWRIWWKIYYFIATYRSIVAIIAIVAIVIIVTIVKIVTIVTIEESSNEFQLSLSPIPQGCGFKGNVSWPRDPFN